MRDGPCALSYHSGPLHAAERDGEAAMAVGTATRLIRLFRAPAEGAFLGLIRRGERVDIVRTVIVVGSEERWHEVDAEPGHGFVKARFIATESPSIEPRPERPPSGPTGREPSGIQWIARFPTSRSTESLAADFRPRCEAFLKALRDAGASVTINATLRPPERAYLMHFSFLINAGEIRPQDVPPKDGVNIDWVHKRQNGAPDLAASIAAAAAMVDRYGIAHRPSLSSLHILGQAIDMNVSWSGALAVRRKNGSVKTIASLPRSGLNHDLWDVGATYGVHKLATDKPHWSINGH